MLKKDIVESSLICFFLKGSLEVGTVTGFVQVDGITKVCIECQGKSYIRGCNNVLPVGA